MSIRKLHLVMPMAGKGARFMSEEFELPKPLIEINEMPFFYWAVQSVKKFVELASLTFVVLEEHDANYGICDKIKRLFPQAGFVRLPHVLNGAALTCLEATVALPDGEPVLFNDCDHLFLCSAFTAFCQSDESRPDGGLLTFQSHDPKYSFALFDDAGNLIRTAEKDPISANAICGAYYFKDKALFASCAAQYLDECEYSEYYVSGIYNVMIRRGMRVCQFPLEAHLPFGTPEEYAEAKSSHLFADLTP